MLSPTKSLKEKIERLIDSQLYNTIRINLILNKCSDELNLIIANKITTLNNIRMKTLIIKERINHERLKYFFR